MCKIDWNLLIQGLTAIGTIAVVIVAIWGDWIKYKLIPPKLTIEPHNLRGTVTRFTNGPRVIYYHLRVSNKRSWSIANNCKVVLRTIARRLPNGDFQRVPLAVEPSFVWAPAETTPPVIELSHDQTVDFGRVVEAGEQFEPVLNRYPNNFDGFVASGQAVRYSLEVVADGFKTNRLQVFEVAWNGQWSDNLDTMSHNLTIREVNG
jgi:hypothetical protein